MLTMGQIAKADSNFQDMLSRWTTPRQLWLLCAALVAANNVAMIHRSQESMVAVVAGLVWIGAWLCLEDWLKEHEPAPSRLSFALGSILLLAGLWRSTLVFHLDYIVYPLLILQGLALLLLLVPIRALLEMHRPILVMLSTIPVLLLPSVISVNALSYWTAGTTAQILRFLGQDVILNGRSVLLGAGGVEVVEGCSGIDMIRLLFVVAVVFVQAFPIRQLWLRLCMLLVAPLIAIGINLMRISLLTLISASHWSEKEFWFEFMHKGEGSYLYSIVAVSIFSWLYFVLNEQKVTNNPEVSHA